jgi:hypothetical protein
LYLLNADERQQPTGHHLFLVENSAEGDAKKSLSSSPCFNRLDRASQPVFLFDLPLFSDKDICWHQ